MQLGYHTICWGGVVGDATGVTSVKDLYYRTPGSMETAIPDIAAAGYAGIEMFDGNVADYADQPAVLQGLLAEAGLELVIVYTGGNFIYGDLLDDELHRVPRAADLARQFGAGNLVVGGGARRPPAPRKPTTTALAPPSTTVTDIAEQRGLTACYHPHLTTIVESPDELDRIMPRSRIGFCPDTAHLAAGGGDPAELIRRYPDRVRHVHLKDFRRDPFAFLPLVRAMIDFADVLRRSRGRLRRLAGRRARLLRRRSRRGGADQQGLPREAARFLSRR